MIVCHCRVVSDRTIRAAVLAGADRVVTVTEITGAGGECRGCLPLIAEIVRETREHVRPPTKETP